MSNEIKNKIDDALYYFFLEADNETIKNSLKDDIHDIAAYEKKKKQIMFMTKAIATKKRNEHLLEIAAKFKEAILQGIEKPVAVLKQLIQTNPAFVLNRNLDKLSNEDIVEIIRDKNLVELLDLLDQDEKNH